MPLLAGIYARLSYSDDGTEERIDRQVGDCRQLAARLDWPVSEDHIFTDPARSAWQRNRKRPGWDGMLAAVDAGEINALLIYHGDRLIRQPVDLEKLLGIADSKGVRLASPSGTRNLDSPDDRFILRIEAAQACRESDNTSRRVRRAIKARVQQGRPVGGGRRAFGFEPNGITHRPEEAAILASMVDRLLAGQSERGVVRWLSSCCTTTAGGPWTGRALKNLVTSPRIAGLVSYGGELYEAAWEPIISVEAWADVQAVIARRAQVNPYRGRERLYLLSGVAQCAAGHRLVSKPTAGRGRSRSRVYWCNTPKCPSQVVRNLALLDAYVEGRVLRVLQDPAFVAEVMAPEASVAPQIAELERRRDEVRAQLEGIVDDEALDAGLLARTLAGFGKRIAALRAQQATSERRRMLQRVAGISAEEWAGLPVDIRSETVRAVFVVTVLPSARRGPGFDVDAVRLERLPLE